MCPFEVVKCRLQYQKSGVASVPKYSGPLHCAAEIVRAEGASGLFNGLRALYWRDVPFNFIFFGVYETCIHFWLKAYPDAKNRSDLSPGAIWLSGGFAGMVGWGIIYPIDVVKSTIQIGATTTTSTAASSTISIPRQTLQMLQTQGPRAFFAGWLPCVMRAFPANAALFLGYEIAMRVLASPS